MYNKSNIANKYNENDNKKMILTNYKYNVINGRQLLDKKLYKKKMNAFDVLLILVLFKEKQKTKNS